MKKLRLYLFLSLGVVFVFYFLSTFHSIGVDGDSPTYFRMAEWIAQFVKGKRSVYDHYFYHFPPLYPALLSLYALFKIKLLTFARFMHLIFLSISVFLMYKLVERECKCDSDDNLLPFYAVSVFFFALVPVHSVALTEELFFTCILLFLYVVVDDRLPVSYALIVLFFILMISSLTRYAGVVLFPLSLVYVFVRIKGSKERIIAIVFLSLAYMPLAAYIYSGWASATKFADRGFGLYGKGMKDFVIAFFRVLIYAFAPIKSLDLEGLESLGEWLFLLLGILVIHVFYYPLYEYLKAKGVKELEKNFSFLFVVFYLIFIFVSRIFFDAHIFFRLRIFSPLVIPMLILWVQAMKKNSLKKTWIILYIGLLFIDGGTLSVLKGQEGWFYASRKWQNSKTILFVKDSLPDNCKIYTNDMNLFYLYLPHRKVQSVPFKYNPWTLKTNKMFDDSIKYISKEVENGPSCVVYFKVDWRSLANAIDFFKIGHLRNFREFNDGVVFCASEYIHQSKTF